MENEDPPGGPFSLYVTDEEKNEAVNRGVRDLRAWRRRNPDAPRGWGERDPRLDTPDPSSRIA